MFKKAAYDDAKRKRVMLVSSHKREEDGPTPIPMSPDTEYSMTVFIEKLRPLVTDDNSPTSKIFLKNDGAPFHKGTIGRRVRAFVVKSGIRPDKAISATDFRKWIVTELKRKKRLGKKIDEQLLRRLLCHTEKTANEWYLRESLTQEAAAASCLIDEDTQPAETQSKPAAASKQQQCREDEKSAIDEHMQPAKTQSKPAAASKQQQCGEDEKSAPEPIHSPKANSASSSRSVCSEKPSLSQAERKQVDLVFAEDIQSGVEPRKKRVVALMKTDRLLCKLVNSEPHVKRVTDRVRYMFQTRKTVDPYELPEESATKRTATFVASIPDRPPSSIESGRVEWSTEETEAIVEALTSYGWKKLPTKREMQAMFQKTQVLRDIFRSNTFERIKNKVKNEHRKLNN